MFIPVLLMCVTLTTDVTCTNHTMQMQFETNAKCIAFIDEAHKEGGLNPRADFPIRRTEKDGTPDYANVGCVSWLPGETKEDFEARARFELGPENNPPKG
jgi:hypothetical protein